MKRREDKFKKQMYTPVIGLEVHIELKTQTKMFCGCPVMRPSEERIKTKKEQTSPKKSFLFGKNSGEPNTAVCPICLGHPGVLPTINKKAVEAVLKLGLALDSKIPKTSKFDRKNYFYPDLPKGYQISQYDSPLCVGGCLEIPSGKIRIRRVHLEEDTGRLIHQKDYSLVDFNRAGIPLMELVTEPDISSSQEARAFAEELQLILKYLEISDADMEKGQMRVEVNVSIRPNGQRIKTNDKQIILADESYKLMSLLFEIHNKLGPIYKEKNYQDAIEEILKRENIFYEREKLIKLNFENLEVSNFFSDFVIDNKILLEVKTSKFIIQEDIRQVLRYIKSANLPLGIIANFRRKKLEYKRLINPLFDFNSLLFVENSGEPLGTKVEIKNLNSFRSVERAIDYEIKRQAKVLESGKKIVQETRGWDENKEMTVSQREKEEAHDYRYLPEPDLPVVSLRRIEDSRGKKMVFDLDRLKIEIPELPKEKRERLIKEFSLSAAEANLLALDQIISEYFEKAVSEFFADYPNLNDKQKCQSIQLIFNYLTSDLKGFLNTKAIGFNDLQITAENFADLIALIFENKISSRTAKDLIPLMQETGLDPKKITEEKGFGQLSDEKSILSAIKQVINACQSAVKDYQTGKTNALQFLIGQTMARLKGRGNPAIIEELLKKELKQ